MVFSVDTARDLVSSDYQQLTNLELTSTEQEVVTCVHTQHLVGTVGQCT